MSVGFGGLLVHVGLCVVAQEPAILERVRSYGRVEKLSCGSNHTAALMDTRMVVAWGYSEQGQLGKNLVQHELRGNRHNGVALTPYPLRVLGDAEFTVSARSACA